MKAELNRLARLYRAPAVGIATLFLLAGGYFGASRDFGAFLLAIIVLPLLLVIAVAATIWAASVKAQRRGALAALVLICLTPLVYFAAGKLRDRVRFMAWAPFHAVQLSRAMGQDRILMLWDDWGMAGTDNFSYLAVDTQDRLGDSMRAEQWRKALGQTCKVADAQRMWPKVYVVRTYTDCPFEGSK